MAKSKKKKATDQEDDNKIVISNPETDEKYTFNSSILEGGDWSGMSQNADNLFEPKQIENYYDVAMDIKLNEGNDFPNGLGDKIKHDWIQEIWNKVNPGVKMLSHRVNNNNDSTRMPKWQMNSWTGNQYTIVLFLTPDMQPEDGGALELWTPNLSDKMKALACNTLYTFGSEEEHNKDLLYSFWPRPGRQVVFDSRIPNMERPVNGDKSCVSLVFQGTNKGYTPESTDDVVEEIDYSEVDFSEVE